MAEESLHEQTIITTIPNYHTNLYIVHNQNLNRLNNFLCPFFVYDLKCHNSLTVPCNVVRNSLTVPCNVVAICLLVDN